jgi:hypothetical protein
MKISQLKYDNLLTGRDKCTTDPIRRGKRIEHRA